MKDKYLGKNRCIADVHMGGRMVGFRQCSNPRGHGPKGQYCKVHAKEHDKSAPQFQLWRINTRLFDFEEVLPERIAVRELQAKTYINELGRRCAMQDQYHEHFKTEDEALAAISIRINESINHAKNKIKRANAAPGQVGTTLP